MHENAPKVSQETRTCGLLHIPTPQHQNKEQPTSTGPNIREDYNYCKTRVSYAEKQYFTFRMYPILKLSYETRAARHFRHFTVTVHVY